MTRPSDGYEPQTFPRFERARAIEVELHEGECLYLPIFWWHGVSGTGRNLILNWWFDSRRDKRDPGSATTGLRARGAPIESSSAVSRIRPATGTAALPSGPR